MTGRERRKDILNRINGAEHPLPAAKLAGFYGVSRQVIVQDIAIIRAGGHDIISTNRGYMINEPALRERVLKVRHTDDELYDELCTIVDLGGTVVNVSINHRVYGHIEAELDVSSRKKAAEFIDDIKSGKSSPLKNITSDYHYHLITAESEEILDLIEKSLKEKGYLVE